MQAKKIIIELNTTKEIGDGCMFKGGIYYDQTLLYPVVAFLKNSKWAVYYFYINEDVPRGSERGKEFGAVTVKAGANGLYCDGMEINVKGLRFPVSGNFDTDTKRIVLKLASEKSISYYQNEKNKQYILSDNAPDPIPMNEPKPAFDEEVPF